MKNMEEIQKKINGYDNYSVSNMGNVRNDKTGRILKPSKDRDGYLKIVLYNNGVKKDMRNHILVAINFLNYIKNDNVIDHINNIPYDNRVENLQIVSNRVNCSKDKNNTYNNKSSKYIGVTFNKNCRGNKKQVSKILIDGKRHQLGYFKTEEEAHQAYQNKLKEINEKREV